MIMRVGDVSDGVDLHKTKVSDDLGRVSRASLGRRQTVGMEPERARLFVRNPKYEQPEVRRADHLGLLRLGGFSGSSRRE